MFKRACVSLPLAAVVLLWSVAMVSAASARTETWSVLYTGSGTLNSKTMSQTSPECGEVTEIYNETTHFSWVTSYKLTMHVGSGGIGGGHDKRDAKASPLASNSSKVTLSDTGCQPGIANCTGEARPQPGQQAVLDVPGAGSGGRSRVEVGAVGGFIGFTGKDFSGGWGFSTGSCAERFNDIQLLQPEFGMPAQLMAKFPVRAATFASLRKGHYFKVHISPGHYAPAQEHTCFASDGCLKDDLSWDGSVKFTRSS